MDFRNQEKETLPMNLIESIKVYENRLCNLPYHKARIAASLRALYDCDLQIDFETIQQDINKLSEELYKLRIVYNNSYFEYEFIPYTFKAINSLKLVNGDHVNYSFKFEDRSALKKLFAEKGKADDILIVKSGLVTDSYYCNVAFLKNGNWYTPYLPLLHGTKRKQLLDNKIIIEETITKEDIVSFEKIRLFNAMIEFGEIEMLISNILDFRII